MVPITTKEVVMNVMIGIDPHKASHTAVAIDGDEDQLSSVKVRATRRQVDQLMSWAEPFEKRTWAIESAGGLGYLLAQQLVARGEDVLDVPATLASRIRVLATESFQQERPQRRPLDRHCGPSGTEAALRRAGRPLRSPAAPGQAQHRPRQPSDPGRLSAPRPLRRARTGRNCQGNVRF